ncbi:MAG: hypothetical protein ACK55I_31310, partial [bacterium]
MITARRQRSRALEARGRPAVRAATGNEEAERDQGEGSSISDDGHSGVLQPVPQRRSADQAFGRRRLNTGAQPG